MLEAPGSFHPLTHLIDAGIPKPTRLIFYFKLVDMFHSLSLRGQTELSLTELEMALGLVDGLDLTRREARTR